MATKAELEKDLKTLRDEIQLLQVEAQQSQRNERKADMELKEALVSVTALSEKVESCKAILRNAAFVDHGVELTQLQTSQSVWFGSQQIEVKHPLADDVALRRLLSIYRTLE